MHAYTIVRQLLRTATPGMHAVRREALLCTVRSALGGSALSVTALGRGLSIRGGEKHDIKRVDRLLSNRHLSDEAFEVYAALARRALAGATSALVSVDWSPLDPAKRHFLLRASVSLDGRAMTLYEEVHPLSRFEKRATKRAFLQRLADVLGPDLTPVILTDAGFQNTWFAAVRAMGWHFIGRVRGVVMLTDERDEWVHARTLYARATPRAQRLRHTRLARSNPINCAFVLVRRPRRGRRVFNHDGSPKRSRYALQHARRASEPWLLATSLDLDTPGALSRVVNAYRTRMQIEEGFRDLKSQRFGLGYDASRSRRPQRIAMLLLIAHIATFVAWVIGACAEACGYQRQYQANTVRSRRVLSRPFLARRIIRDPSLRLPTNLVNDAITLLQSLVQNHPLAR